MDAFPDRFRSARAVEPAAGAQRGRRFDGRFVFRGFASHFFASNLGRHSALKTYYIVAAFKYAHYEILSGL